MKGIVKWFNNAKGYGFIKGEDGNDVFIHYSNILCEGYKTLNAENKVEYSIKHTDKGLHAEELIIIN